MVLIYQFYKDLDARMESIRQQDKGWRYSKAGDRAAIKEVYDRMEAEAALGEAEEAAERAAGGGGGGGGGGGYSTSKSRGKFSTNKFGSSGAGMGAIGGGGTGGGVYSGTKSGKWTPKGSNIHTVSATEASTSNRPTGTSKETGPNSTVKPEIPRRVWTKKGDLGGGYRGYGDVVVDSTNKVADASAEKMSDGL